MGKEITELQPVTPKEPGNEGSLLAVIATDAPLFPHQLKRVAKRAVLGMARTGAISSNSSGDLFFAFSTATPGFADGRQQWIVPFDPANSTQPGSSNARCRVAKPAV